MFNGICYVCKPVYTGSRNEVSNGTVWRTRTVARFVVQQLLAEMDFIRSLAHPDEIVALLRFRFGGGRETITPSLQEVRPLARVDLAEKSSTKIKEP